MADKPEAHKKPLLEIVTRLWDPTWLRDWALPYHQRSGWKAFGVRQLEVFVLTVRSLRQEEITLRAAALTYRTLLSIVPMLAVGFALFKAFGGLRKLEEPLRQVIVENLAVGRQNQVGQWLDTVIGNINAGAIAGVGVLLLFYSSVGLLTNIEESINRIWGIHRGRPFLMRFFTYWGLITLAPPLVGFSVSLSAQLQNSEFATAVVQWLPFGLGRALVWFGSALSTCLAFVLSYMIVPNTRVRFRAALLGGVVAGLLWNISKEAFLSLSANSIKYSAVYGALGVLPLLMLWMYLSWIIVLFGATYAFANQSVYTEGLEMSSLRMTQRFRETLAARLMLTIAERFHAGEPPLTAEQLAERVGTLTSVVQRILDILVANGVAAETRADGDERGFLPGRGLQELTLERVMHALRVKDGSSFALGDDPAHAELMATLEAAERAGRELLAQSNLRGLAVRARELRAAQGDGGGEGEAATAAAPGA